MSCRGNLPDNRVLLVGVDAACAASLPALVDRLAVLVVEAVVQAIDLNCTPRQFCPEAGVAGGLVEVEAAIAVSVEDADAVIVVIVAPDGVAEGESIGAVPTEQIGNLDVVTHFYLDAGVVCVSASGWVARGYLSRAGQ